MAWSPSCPCCSGAELDPALHPGWPARLAWGPVELRPLRRADAREWARLRTGNERWLTPWEPSAAVSWADRHTPAAYRAMRRAASRRAGVGMSLPFAVHYEGRLAGQVTVGNIFRGALRSGYLGYWVGSAVAGRGVASLAVALGGGRGFRSGWLRRWHA